MNASAPFIHRRIATTLLMVAIGLAGAAAFRLLPAAEPRGIKRIVWIDNPSPLRSGWAWGQRYLSGVTEVLQAPVGKGMLVLFGPDPYFRSQPHGTFKLLFNGLLYRNDLGD